MASRTIFRCEICWKDCDSDAELQHHEMIHYGVKPFVCQTCFRAFTEETKLEEHVKSHREDKDDFQRCDLCFKTFQTADELIRHRLEIHCKVKRGAKKPGYEIENFTSQIKCGYCDRFFEADQDLFLHMDEHLDDDLTVGGPSTLLDHTSYTSRNRLTQKSKKAS